MSLNIKMLGALKFDIKCVTHRPKFYDKDLLSKLETCSPDFAADSLIVYALATEQAAREISRKIPRRSIPLAEDDRPLTAVDETVRQLVTATRVAFFGLTRALSSRISRKSSSELDIAS